jgi:uncharacterized membrane protein YdjX (TVP38/TMEM64 family)
MNMTELFTNIDNFIKTFLLNLGLLGPIIGCFLILIESIVPVLPLFVFITINFLTFGYVIGFLLSWIFTVLGCLLSFLIFRKGVRNWFTKKIRKNQKLENLMNKIYKMKLESLAIIIAVPSTPAFLVNIAAGLSKMSIKKYVTALIIGKIFLVLFWGLVGTSLIESLTNPLSLLKLAILLIMAYIISRLVSKKINID